MMDHEGLKLVRSGKTPIYHQLGHQLAQMIARGVLAPGLQLPGVPALGKRLHITDRTVRQAYRILEEKGLVKVIKGKGTFILDPRVRIQSVKTITVLHNHPLNQDHEDQLFCLGVYRGISAEARARGWKVTFVSPYPNSDEQLAELQASGFIVFAANTDSLGALLRLKDAGAAAVTIDGPDGVFLNVRSDDDQGISLVIDHLYHRGHRRIGLLADSPLIFSTQRRTEAYFRAMGAHHLNLRPSWIHTTRSLYLQDESEQEELFRKMFEGDQPPTAVVTMSGYTAMSLLQVLHRHDVDGKVPDQVSVCGYDDWRAFAFAAPPLTTVRQPLESLSLIHI